MKSQFGRDLLVEKEISEYLDNHFYSKIVDGFKRYEDESAQNQGIDVHFEWPTLGKILVDEKSNSSAKYINKFIPTFAFEIKNTRSGNIGWLIDNKKLTEYYLLIYVWANNAESIPISINKLHCILVSRKSIRDYLQSNRYSDNELITKCDMAKKNDLGGKIPGPNNDFYFFYTSWLQEQPFNVIIRRNILSNLSIAEFEIDNGVINKLKGF